MLLKLQNKQVAQLQQALADAGSREIGGQLFGEQLEPSNFRITDLTVQRRRGSFARFVVDLLQAARDAINFFERTDQKYLKFNYIGEWHSHPSFEVRPSGTDVQSMRELVGDPEFKGNFAVLLITRLDANHVNCGAWLFGRNREELPVTLEVES